MLMPSFRRPVQVAILSDLHLETGPWPGPQISADLVLLAGDVHEGACGVPWAAHAFSAPVAYVPGNHEFYGGDVAAVLAKLQCAALGHGAVTVLERESTEYRFRRRFPLEKDAAVRVVGAILWTDFLVCGDRDTAESQAVAELKDFQRIRNGNGALVTPKEIQKWHAETVRWLDRTLAEPFEGLTVVVTHYAPSPRSLPDHLAVRPLGAAFASDLERLIHAHEPALWVHGHTHHDVDYRIGRTRVLSRQRGPARDGKDLKAAVVTL